MTSRLKNMIQAQDTQDKNRTLRERFPVNFLSILFLLIILYKVCYKFEHMLRVFTLIQLINFAYLKFNEIIYASLRPIAACGSNATKRRLTLQSKLLKLSNFLKTMTF